MMRRFVFICMTVIAVCSAHAQMVEDYRFKGRVLDGSGKPVAGVKITLRDIESGTRFEFKSHDDGTFDRRMIPHAKYEAVFAKAGYATHTEMFDWSISPDDVETVEVQVVLASEAERAKQEMGRKAAALYEEAYAALQKNDCGQASAKAREILTLGAGGYEYAVRFIMARCHAVQGRNADAIAEYEKVLALKPDFFEARFDLATLLEKQGQHDAALEQYDQAAALRPDDVEVQYNVGAMLLQRQMFERARVYLQKAVELDSTHAEAAKGLGFAYLQGETRDVEAARRYLERYLVLKPNASDATEIRAIIAEMGKASTQ